METGVTSRTIRRTPWCWIAAHCWYTRSRTGTRRRLLEDRKTNILWVERSCCRRAPSARDVATIVNTSLDALFTWRLPVTPMYNKSDQKLNIEPKQTKKKRKESSHLIFLRLHEEQAKAGLRFLRVVVHGLRPSSSSDRFIVHQLFGKYQSRGMRL